MESAAPGVSPLIETGLWLVAAGFAGAAALSLLWALAKRFRKEDFRVGEDFGHERANVVEWNGKSGYVEIGGELWRAVSTDALAPGDAVTIARADGLVLEVRKRPQT
ncbi:MAG TPA: NfeD family protein [Parvularculaceae bacterium]|nr:NfeD family protein [Parvularculaceae bacterium]